MKIFIYLVKSKSVFNAIALLIAMLLSGCALEAGFSLPEPLPEPESSSPSAVSSQPELIEQQKMIVRSQSLPPLQVAEWQDEEGPRWEGLELPEGQFDLNVESLPLNEFIHVALGDVLGLTYDMSPTVSSLQSLITLRISTPVSAQRMLGMIEQTIAAYDVGLAWDTGALHVLPGSEMAALPPIPSGSISGLTNQLGRVMTIIPLRYGAAAEVMSLVRQFLNVGSGAEIFTMSRLNALMVIGTPANIERFKSAVNMVDKPAVTGQNMRLIKTVYWKASEIEPILKDALRVQGIGVAAEPGQPGVHIIPIAQLNALLVAAPNQETIGWIENWIEGLDTPNVIGDSQRSFVYFVQNSTAEELGLTISAVIGGISANRNSLGSEQAEAVGSDQLGGILGGSNSSLRLVIDESHNSLVFVGNAQDYQIAYQLLQILDIPAKQVLIEVTIADVTLDKSQQLGVEWQFTDFNSSGNISNTVSTLGGLGGGGAGFVATAFDNQGDIRVRLNALSANGDARILSNPKLLALDNEEASIQVGTQIAIISSEVGNLNSGAGGQDNVLRSFEYIDTGVILKFTPTVLANGVVRLNVYQEVSSPGPSNNNTPPIAKRTLETTLIAQSGQTVMLGGLITHNTTQQYTSVPILGEIPVVGGLFRTRQDTENSTEMMILITPHVIETPLQADELTEAFRLQLGW